MVRQRHGTQQESEGRLQLDASKLVQDVMSDPRLAKSGTVSNEPRKPRAKITYLILKWTLFSIFFALGVGQFIAGDILWGYRGRYVKKATYFPVSIRA